MNRAVRLGFTLGTAIAVVLAVSQGTAHPQTNAGTPLQFPRLPKESPFGVRNDLPNPYREGVSWGKLPEGRKWGSTASVTVGPDGSVWVVDRCGVAGAGGATCAGTGINPIFEFDPSSGKLLKNVGAGLFVSPHKLTVDKAGNLWVADNGLKDGRGQQVFKLSPDGKVLMTLGKAGIAGPGPDTFDQPTEVAIAPNGDIFVGDGHGNQPTNNARIVKFDKTGKFIKAWGKKGTGRGEFDCVHTLAFDSRGRLFVADSESRDGAAGYGFDPGVQRGIRIGSARDGSVQYFIPDPAPYPYKDDWPTPGSRSAGSSMAEGVALDAQGNVYGAEFLMDLKKYVKK